MKAKPSFCIAFALFRQFCCRKSLGCLCVVLQLQWHVSKQQTSVSSASAASGWKSRFELSGSVASLLASHWPSLSLSIFLFSLFFSKVGLGAKSYSAAIRMLFEKFRRMMAPKPRVNPQEDLDLYSKGRSKCLGCQNPAFSMIKHLFIEFKNIAARGSGSGSFIKLSVDQSPFSSQTCSQKQFQQQESTLNAR